MIAKTIFPEIKRFESSFEEEDICYPLTASEGMQVCLIILLAQIIVGLLIYASI